MASSSASVARNNHACACASQTNSLISQFFYRLAISYRRGPAELRDFYTNFTVSTSSGQAVIWMVQFFVFYDLTYATSSYLLTRPPAPNPDGIVSQEDIIKLANAAHAKNFLKKLEGKDNPPPAKSPAKPSAKPAAKPAKKEKETKPKKKDEHKQHH